MPPITDQHVILTNDYFHVDGSKNADGSCATWRRNGMTKLWVTRPGAYRIPVKRGLRQYDYITHTTDAHTEKDCPNHD